ncbi:MAG: GDSL-type esterase/lipase family protein [Balneola sp.]
MALSNKQKSYIKKHSKKKSAGKVASDLNLEESEVQAYMDTLKEPLPLKKKVLFYGITISIPFLFFIILELILRSTNYLGNTDLFIDPNIPTDEYRIPNPNFASRYFFYTNVIPSPSIDVFLAEKPKDSYRIFAMGGSTAAGYPYGFNGTFSRVVDDVLQDALPDKNVEVVNVGISAINTYTLYDQLDEIIEHKPDAVMIYAGHNEFYGALGVGSNENLGAFPGFVRFYLKLQRFKTFLFLRTIIVDTGKWFATTFSDKEVKESGTLMERIVNSRSIELDSPKYELAMIQFESNISTIIETFEKEGIPVFIGSVASNVKDQKPFVDITDGEEPSALSTFREAQNALDTDDFGAAKEKFNLAKDLDGLKFRAPSEINEIIKNQAAKNPLTTYVPVHEAFEENSDEGLIGFDLMLEHLHPNQRGYFLIGKTFSEVILNDLEQKGITRSEIQSEDWDNYFRQMHLTYFDHRVEWHRISTLKQGFPFVQGAKPTPYQFSYSFTDYIDSLAYATVHENLGWDRAKVEAASFYENTEKIELALEEYFGLIRNQPWNDSPYVFAARLYLDRNEFDKAEPLLREAYLINKEEPFITKMLGAIELNRGNQKKAIELLEKSISINPRDPQALFNLSGAYGTNQEFQKAIETAQRVQQLSPNFPGLRGWMQQLEQIIQSRK